MSFPMTTGRRSAPALLAAALGIAATVAGATWLTLQTPLLGAGLLYVGLFWFIVAKRPGWAALLIFAVSPFQNDLSGGGFAKFSLAEINLLLTLPILLVQSVLRRRLPAVGPILLPILLYFAVSVYSSLVSWHSEDSLLSLVQMLLYFVAAVMVFSSLTPRPDQLMPSLWALVAAGIFLAVGSMVTSYMFLGLNKNAIGGWLACTLLICTELWLAAEEPRRRFFLLFVFFITAAGLLLSLSRGAWLGTLGGLIVIVALRRQYLLLLRGLLTLLPLLAICWNALPQESKQYATGFSTENYSINARYESLAIAQKYFLDSPLYGSGVGLRKEYDATNVVMLTLAETGVLGLVGFLLIHLTFFRMVWVTHKRIDQQSYLFSLLTIAGALVTNKLMHGLVDHYWTRGTIMVTWASVGMATRVYLIARQQADEAGETGDEMSREMVKVPS